MLCNGCIVLCNGCDVLCCGHRAASAPAPHTHTHNHITQQRHLGVARHLFSEQNKESHSGTQTQTQGVSASASGSGSGIGRGGGRAGAEGGGAGDRMQHLLQAGRDAARQQDEACRLEAVESQLSILQLSVARGDNETERARHVLQGLSSQVRE